MVSTVHAAVSERLRRAGIWLGYAPDPDHISAEREMKEALAQVPVWQMGRAACERWEEPCGKLVGAELRPVRLASSELAVVVV